MVKWIFRLFLLAVVVTAGSTTYDAYVRGYFDIPEMPDGAYQFSFKHGMRGIVLNAAVSDQSVGSQPKFLRRMDMANPDRRYFGVPFDVAPWMVNAWSTCTAPDAEAVAYFKETMPVGYKQKLEYARFDAVCVVDVDSEKVLRGLLYSVPKL